MFTRFGLVFPPDRKLLTEYVVIAHIESLYDDRKSPNVTFSFVIYFIASLALHRVIDDDN